jgi:glycosyltransferase involved in cell wall biosynthesis
VLFSDALVLPTLLDVCDCRTLFYRRQLARGGLGGLRRMRVRQLLRRFEAFERYLLERYPIATAVSPLDRDELLRLRPGARVEVIPNGVDLEMFRPLAGEPERPDNLIFFGNMDFLPNVDAAVHFAREILPRVRERRLQATFTIVGTNPAPEVLELARTVEGVEVTGGVPDLKPWIQKAAMLVAPMRFGAGMKNKILEALAMEKPVVTNPTGIESFAPELRPLLRVAHDDDEFADLVCDLLEAPEERRRIGASGRALMQRLYSWEAAAERYEALLRELALTGSRG